MPPPHRGLGVSSAAPTSPSSNPLTPDPDELREHRQWLLSRTGGGNLSSWPHDEARQSHRLRRPVRFVPATRLSTELVVGEDEERRAERERRWLEEREQRETMLRQEEDRERIRGVFGDEEGGGEQPSEELAPEVEAAEAPPPQETPSEPDNLSTFYASLVSQMPVEPLRPRPVPLRPALDRPASPSSHAVQRKRDYRQTLGQEWFIKRAEEALIRRRNEEQQAEREAVVEAAGGDQAPVKGEDVLEAATTPSTASTLCPSCHLPLPSPLTPASQAAHKRSLAHLLASETGPPLLRPTSTASSTLGHLPRDATDPHAAQRRIERERELVVLERSNRGYEALRRMGWKLGMGLGREEWKRAGGGEDMGSEKPTQTERRHTATGWSSGEAIEVLDSEDEEREQALVTAAGLNDRQDATGGHLRSSKPSFTPPAIPAASTTSVQEHASSKARLVPVLATVRPDRRGIGIALPISSSSSRSAGAARQQTNGAGQSQTKRMTPGQRRKDAKREREELDRIREELDW